MKKRFHDVLSFRITCALALALLLVGLPFFVVFYRLHERQLIEGMRQPMTDLSQLILAGLEKRMLEHQPHLLDQDIPDLSAQAEGARIMILDQEGRVRVSSDPSMAGKVFRKDHAICLSCHRTARVPEQTVLIGSGADAVARNVMVIRNRKSCLSCHAAGQAKNGILVLDLPMAQAAARLRSDMYEMLALAALMATVTVFALLALIDRLVVRRIKAVERTMVAVREGNLDERVEVRGNDEISELAVSFNVMTATLKASLDDVERHRSYLENVINSIEDEIVVVDRSFRVVTANEAYLKNHESTKDGLVGRSCCAGCNGSQCDMASREECPARNTFETGNVEKRLCRFHDPTGRERFIEIYSYPLTDAGGRVFQAIEVRRDITERRFLEANLCHADRLASLGLLASGFSHEINNPLASIVTCSEGLHKRMIRKAGNGSPDTQEILDYLGVISKEAMRAKAITERLLILARRSPSVTYLVSVNRSLAETVLLIRFQAESKQVRIVEQYDPALPEIKGDDPGLRQVFLNLLLNALQATEPGGRVTVRTEMAADTLRVSIEDTGRGIPAEDLPRLFEPFFSRRPTGEGSGLGLFISNTLVRQMGGYLEVSSLPGEGSCFTLTLPVTGRLTACPDRPESALDVV